MNDLKYKGNKPKGLIHSGGKARFHWGVKQVILAGGDVPEPEWEIDDDTMVVDGEIEGSTLEILGATPTIEDHTLVL